MSTSSGSGVEAAGGVGASILSQVSHSLKVFNMGLDNPRSTPPPRPVILLSLAGPPARILASRLSLRSRACSETLEVGASGDDVGIGGVSAMFGLLDLARKDCWCVMGDCELLV